MEASRHAARPSPPRVRVRVRVRVRLRLRLRLRVRVRVRVRVRLLRLRLRRKVGVSEAHPWAQCEEVVEAAEQHCVGIHVHLLGSEVVR